MKTKDWLLLGALGFAAYYAYKKFTGAAALLTSAGEAAGGAVYELFHPDTVGETLFYTVSFPGGVNHAVPSRSVATDGTFTYQGTNYRLMVDRTKATGINKVAVPI